MGYRAGIEQPVTLPPLMQPFHYPDARHIRRHGPRGYAHHEGYRPWLRDEFAFRCVYCLSRERWGKGHYGFHVDHLIPQSTDSSRVLDYDNLFYACATCNEMKSNAEDIPSPCLTAYGHSVVVHDNGAISALDDLGTLLIKVLRLDNPENTEYRRLMLEILRLAQAKDPQLYREWMSFPADMPNLAVKRPPRGNFRREGIRDSFFMRRKRNELPETY
jgi:hypothetical protein